MKRLLCGEWLTEEDYFKYITCQRCFKIKTIVKNEGLYTAFECDIHQ